MIIDRPVFLTSGMVSEEDSIFNYTDGQSYSTFKDTNFTPIFELTPSEDQQQEAEQICGELIMKTLCGSE